MQRNTFNYLRALRLAYMAGMPQVEDETYDQILEAYLEEPDIPESHVRFLSATYDNDPVNEEVLSLYGFDDVAEVLLSSEGVNTSSQSLKMADFSINAVTTEDDLRNWYKQFPDYEDILLAIKVDGVRGNQDYINKGGDYLEFDGTFSRGDNGKAVLYDAAASEYVPKVIKMNQSVPSITICGELHITDDSMQEVRFLKGMDYASNLNAAVSCARTGIGFGKDALLKFSAYRVFGWNFPTKSMELKFLRDLEVPVVQHIVIERCDSFETLLQAAKSLRRQAKELGIPHDGIVISLDRNTGAGVSSEVVALKLDDWVTSVYSATITGFTFDMIGQSSNARILIEPTKTREGKTVTHINAYNPSFILNKLRVGDTVKFKIRSNNNIMLVIE